MRSLNSRRETGKIWIEKNRESQLIFPTTPAAFGSGPGWSYRPYLPPRGWRPVSQKPPQSGTASHRQEGNDIQLLSYNAGLLSIPGQASPTLSRRSLLGCSPQHQTTRPSLLLGFSSLFLGFSQGKHTGQVKFVFSYPPTTLAFIFFLQHLQVS